MTRDERDELIWAYAIGALNAADAQIARAILAEDDPADAATFAEASTTLAQLPLALDRRTPPPAARQRLLTRVAASQSTGRKIKTSSLPWMLATVAAAAAIVLGISNHNLNKDAERNFDVRTQLLRQLASAQQLASAASLPELKTVSLSTKNSSARGRVFWDQSANQWHVFVFDLAPPPTGREYQLWFITPDQEKIPSGTFTVDAHGSGSIDAKLPPGNPQLALAAITDEPIGGSLHPTGSVQLAGKIE